MGCSGDNALYLQGCAWWQRLQHWFDAAYPGMTVSVIGEPRSGMATQWFAQNLDIRGNVARYLKCDVLFLDHSMNDAAVVAGQGAAGEATVSEAVHLINRWLRQHPPERVPAAVWIYLPRILSLQAAKGGDFVNGNATRGVLRDATRPYGAPVVSYADVVVPEIRRLVRAGHAATAAVLHNAGKHGAHIDWRNHQLIADTVSYWWREEALRVCGEARRGGAPAAACGSALFTADENSTAGLPRHCAGSIRTTDRADGLPPLVAVGPTEWSLYQELPNKPPGWHPPHSEEPNGTATGPVAFKVTCLATGSALELADAAVALGTLRTYDASWGSVDVWTEFLVPEDPNVVALRTAGFYSGAKPTRIDARWSDRSSERVLDRVPCYDARPDAHGVAHATASGAPPVTVKLRLVVLPSDPGARFKVMSVESCDRLDGRM